MSANISIGILASRTPLVNKTVAILRRTLHERCALAAVSRSGGDCTINLAIDPALGAECYRIASTRNGMLTITGGDERGLLYGAGRTLHEATMMPGRFIPGSWRGVARPTGTVRGIYFATHFHNFYHDAPVAEIARYVEDLALWGCNSLLVWFDMHHYAGVNDPAAKRMIVRLKAILQAAQDVGIRPGLTILANEAYGTSPKQLRAQWTAGHDGYHHEPCGHYHVEVCPSSRAGLDQILRDRRAMLKSFAGVDLEYIMIWPYDQGGCTCSKCTPWGANGYLKAAKPVAALTKSIFPKTRVVLSTWYFDHFINGEWAAFDKAFKSQKTDWVDYLLVDDYGDKFPEYPLKHGVPAGLPMVSFPEISMYAMGPWGGFGANPLPLHFQHIWNKAGKVLQGGFPYSEGIFEDLNKVVMLQFFWNRRRRAVDVVRDYVKAYFGTGATDIIIKAIGMLERQHGAHSISVTMDGITRGFWEAQQFLQKNRCKEINIEYVVPRNASAPGTRKLFVQADSKLPPAIRRSWRWRLLMIRAELDDILVKSRGRPTARTKTLFNELIEIYSSDIAKNRPQDAEWMVVPPEADTMRGILLKKRILP